MRRSFSSFVAALLFSTHLLSCSHSGLFSSSSISSGPEEIRIRKIDSMVWLIEDPFPWPAYSMLVEMKNGTLVRVDTAYTPDGEKEVLRWMNRQFGKRKIIAINTHAHADRMGGNEALVLRQIPIYGSDLTAELIKRKSYSLPQITTDGSAAQEKIKEKLLKQQLFAPTRTFPLKDGLKLTLGEETVELIFPGPGHSPDNLVVYFPSRSLLYGGCLVVSSDRPGNLSEANLQSWPEAIEKLIGLQPTVVIPGHPGSFENRFSPTLLAHTIRAVQSVTPPFSKTASWDKMK